MRLRTFSKKVLQAAGLHALLLFLLFSVPLVWTLPDYGITHDEPIYLEASRSVRQWLSLDWRTMLSAESVEGHWKTDPLRNVHPSGVKWLYLLAQATLFWEKDPYTQTRLLFILLLSGSLALFLQWNFAPSLSKSALTVLLLLSMPHFFAHSHFAATDMPMTAFLMLFVMSASRGMEAGKPWLGGLLLGILASIKATSVLLALPLLALFLISHRKEFVKGLRTALLLGLTAVLTFYLLNPDWWYSPLSRASEFIAQTVTRKDWAPLSVLFGGTVYSYRAPFTYPFVMFFITTPLLHILFLLVGLGRFFRDKTLRADQRMIAGLVCFLTPFVLLALPLSPTIDGIRYLLPAFPFAACWMTTGLVALWKFITRSQAKPLAVTLLRLGLAVVSLALFALDLHNPARRPPYELSYYNSLVGGLAGAHRRGYETTYWWEILNESALREVNALTSGSRVYFPVLPTDLFFVHARNKGMLTFAVAEDVRDVEFILIFGRPNVSYWEEGIQSSLKKEGKTIAPVWEISIDSVPLLRLHRVGQASS